MSDRGGQRLVPRRLEERAPGPHRLRAPVRAPDVRRLRSITTRGYFQPLQGAGALLNGSTNADRTNYWEVVPTGAVELALWMESDRMGYLLPALTEAKFTNQRDVVLNERRQNYENRPYGLAAMATLAALYPPDHPYHWLTIGEVADFGRRRSTKCTRSSARYYHPAQRVARDGRRHRRPSGARAGGASTSARSRPGPTVEPVPATAALTGEIAPALEDRVELPRLYIAWHSPAMFADGDAELDLVTDLLANGKTSRLYSGWCSTSASPPTSRPRRTRARSAASSRSSRRRRRATRSRSSSAVDRRRDRAARRGGPDRRRDGARPRAGRGAVRYRLQTVGGFGGKSDQLNAYNVFLGDPAYFDRDLARYYGVSASLAAARRAALPAIRRGA